MAPQLPEEVKSLLGLPHLMRDVCGPGEVGRDVEPKELKAFYPLYLLPVHVEGRELCAFGFLEIHNHFLGFRGV